MLNRLYTFHFLDWYGVKYMVTTGAESGGRSCHFLPYGAKNIHQSVSIVTSVISTYFPTFQFFD